MKLTSKHTFQISSPSAGKSKRIPFSTLNEVCIAYRMFITQQDVGASGAGQCLIYDGAGKQVAYVSFNGKVWEGHPKNWKPGMTPIFNPYAEAVCAS